MRLHRTTVTLGIATALLVAAIVPAAAFAGTFGDDDGSVHEPNIEAIAAAGITLGCGGTDFCPQDGVTRGQMASFLARALDLAGDPPDAFTDDDSSTHEASIDLIAEAGITAGCGGTEYCPDEVVTRAQMASFLARALDDLVPAGGDWFTDDEGNVHEANINVLRENEITLGCAVAGDLYCPADDVTRGQMASFLARGLGLDPIIPEPDPDPDPDWYTTPTVTGVGARVIVVPTSGSPTLEEALEDAQPGDLIELAPGTHRVGAQGNHVISSSGTASAWIAIRGQAGARPVIDLEGAGEFRISASHVVFEHLEVVNGGGNNIHIAPESSDISHIVLRDFAVSDLASGPGAAVKINRNNPEGTGASRVYLEDCDVSEAISNAIIDGVGVEQSVVRDCWIHDNATGSHGIFFKGGSDGILIERNVISAIRANAALQLGGNTGASFWNPAHPDWEGVDQVARNNLVTDVDDSLVEIRGVNGARVYHNTFVSQTSFAVFRLQTGNTAAGGVSDNADVHIANNLVVATGGDPQYARNDGSADDVIFGRQLWAGALHNSGAPTPGIPIFPLAGDVVVASDLATVLVDPTVGGLSGIADAASRYRPSVGSPALGAGLPVELVRFDFEGGSRAPDTPSLGAFELP